MKLYYNPASPYVRKVRVLAMETGLMDDIELAKVTITPTDPDEGWRDSRPKLAAWFEKFATRPSMGETLPYPVSTR